MTTSINDEEHADGCYPEPGEKADPNAGFNVGLQLSDSDTNQHFSAILKATVKKHVGNDCTSDLKLPCWPVDFFKLNRTKQYSHTSVENQRRLQRRCSQVLVEEALLIEKCGMAFGIKMSSLAETVGERMFYNLMAAEETLHYHQIGRFLANNPDNIVPTTFHELLANLISEGDRDSLIFFVQVVLEGWGIDHYKSLADHCLCPIFTLELKEIIKDEARHHGSGVALSKERKFSNANSDYLFEMLRNFLMLVQSGSQSTLSVVESVFGKLTCAQKIELLHQVDSEQRSSRVLNKLRELILNNGGVSLVDRLDAYRCFVPFPVEKCI